MPKGIATHAHAHAQTHFGGSIPLVSLSSMDQAEQQRMKGRGLSLLTVQPNAGDQYSAE